METFSKILVKRAVGSMLAICGLLFSLPMVSGQSSCPDWSPKFDQIDDPSLLQGVRQMRATGWAAVIQQGVAQGVSAQQQIATFEQTLQQMQMQVAADQSTWRQIGVGPKPRVNAQACKNPSGDAAFAALCDEHLKQNGILLTEGTLDIMRCYAGLLPGTTVLSGTGGTPDSPRSQQNTAESSMYDSALAQQNLSKRDQMVRKVAAAWSAPQQLRTSSSSLDVTNLSDPFASPTNSEPASTVDASLPVSTIAAADSSPREEWSYPLATDAPTDSGITLTAPPLDADHSWKDTLVAIEKDGIGASEGVGATVVGFVDNSENWAKFYSPNSTDQVDGAVGVAQDINSRFNPNEISKAISGDVLGIVDTNGKKMINTMGALDRAWTDNSPEEVDAAFRDVTTFDADALPLVKSVDNGQQAVQEGWRKIQTTVDQWVDFVSGKRKCEALFGDNTCE